jgi:hypothetical protein
LSVAELQELEEVKLLITKGTQTGVLTYAEVATALTEVDLDESDIEDLHTFLEKSEIELVEEIDPATTAAQEERAVDRKDRRRKSKATIDLKPDMTTDSLQLFLKDIGKVRLLTAQEEVDLARRPFGAIDNPIRMMEADHEAAGAAMARIRELTGGYVAPEDGCTTYRVGLQELEAFEQDLHAHVHLENNILFPKARRLVE